VQVGEDCCEAELVEQAAELDLALLRLKQRTFESRLAFASRIRLKRNSPAPQVVAYGFRDIGEAELLSQSLEGNVVSGGTLGRTFQLTGSELYPGFSGGPLLQWFFGGPLCVGMTLRGNPSEKNTAASSVFLHSGTLAGKLQEWGIRVPLEKSPISWRPVIASAMLITGLSVAGAVSYFRSQSASVCKTLETFEGAELRENIREIGAQWMKRLAKEIPNDNRVLRDRIDERCSDYK
jgi:hypothetical protein